MIAVLIDSAYIAHIIVLVLYAFRDREFISALLPEVYADRHVRRMVTHFVIIDILN